MRLLRVMGISLAVLAAVIGMYVLLTANTRSSSSDVAPSSERGPERSVSASSSDAGDDLDDGEEKKDGGIIASELGWIRPVNIRLFELAGEKDVGDRYPFAVMVKTRAPMEAGVKGECSGVLVSPNLVLTAGHCVCVQ